MSAGATGRAAGAGNVAGRDGGCRGDRKRGRADERVAVRVRNALY